MPSHQGCHDFAFHPTWPILGLCVFRLVLDYYILAVENILDSSQLRLLIANLAIDNDRYRLLKFVVELKS